MSDRISKDASEAWRDHVLKQVVDYLERNRDEIIDGFEAENAHNLKRKDIEQSDLCLLYTSPSPRDRQKSRMPSSA